MSKATSWSRSAASRPSRDIQGTRRGITMPYVITEPCIGVKDASCVDVCPVDCIHTTDDAPQYYINPDQCIDCAACELVCPVEAIVSEHDIRDEWVKYIAINADFFQ
jgi:NAD-dependent dihydropyrimidine dehydrogenase PreA subunit